jgi:uncharacterized membrane protein
MNVTVPAQQRGRIRSVDVLRGAIVVLMAIDHVRVYSGLPAGGPSPGIFFTRWVTHFCAPGFVFFAGVGAFLYGLKLNDKKAFSRFLLSRGLLLIFLELTLIRFFWTFNFDYGSFTLAGVIWMLGWCMVIMAALVRMKARTVGIVGILIILLQQLFGLVPKIFPASIRPQFGKFWEFIYSSGLDGPSFINILYVIVPWIGVMAAGYGFGLILIKEEKNRNKICWWLGISSIVLFLIIGTVLAARNHNAEMPFLFRLLNQQKYPPSQVFLLMTLGPLTALVPFAEKARGWLSKTLQVFGKVPMFYYLLHIPLIHLSALLVNTILAGSPHQEFYDTSPYTQMPENFRWSLGLLYLVFLVVVGILYFLCKAYGNYKAKHPEKKWLRYI